MDDIVAVFDPARAQFQLKVTLLHTRPTIWRRLLVPADLGLPKLHAVLQVAFGWTNSHLHAFRVGDLSYEAYYPDLWAEPAGPLERRDESKFRLCDLLQRKDDRLLYEYDFGDEWEHELHVEKITNAARPALRCKAGARAAPPEDCGGACGYEDLVEAMADPEHPERERLLQWLGEPYDADAFDREAINRKLKRYKA